jgi:RNA polymerase sigma-70 factor (ECF subfamily)
MAAWDLSGDPLLALRGGDPRPFEDFVRARARTFFAFFRQRGASLPQAEDLTQEVFLKLYQYAGRYQPEERFPAYCFRIARNVWIDDCRRAGVRIAPASGADETPEAHEPEAVPEDPLEGLVLREGEQQVRELLRALSGPQREVFELAILGELSYAEIADLLAIPVGTVKSRMFYAVRRLRELRKDSGAGSVPAGREGGAG